MVRNRPLVSLVAVGSSVVLLAGCGWEAVDSPKWGEIVGAYQSDESDLATPSSLALSDDGSISIENVPASALDLPDPGAATIKASGVCETDIRADGTITPYLRCQFEQSVDVHGPSDVLISLWPDGDGWKLSLGRNDDNPSSTLYFYRVG